MSAYPVETMSITGYQLRLPVFEGPLDVLLRLVERSHLAITDVSLVAVTDQFLDYVAGLRSTEPEVLAEFAAVGSRLVLLKSRSLLPRPPVIDDDEAADELLHQLIEYRAVKEAAQQLAQRDALGTGAFARGTGAVLLPIPSGPPRLAFHQSTSLVRAVRRRLAVLPSVRESLAASSRISIREMIERLLGLLPSRGCLSFSAVAQQCNNRHEVLTAFLALLVLVRRRVLDASQESVFGEIELRRGDADALPLEETVATQAADD